MKRFGTLLGRAARLRCPRCGRGKLFRGWIAMHETCDQCGLKYERAPGYFLGSVYVNYGVTALIVAITYPLLVFRYGFDGQLMLWGSLSFVILFPVLFWRHSRSIWMAFDQLWDPATEEDPQ